MHFLFRRIFTAFLLLVAALPAPGAFLEVPPDIKAYLTDPNHSVGEDGILPFNEPETVNFVKFVVVNWRAIGANLDQIAASPPEQCLVVAAAEMLSPRDYVEFVGEVCDHDSESPVSPQAISTILEAGMNKNGFWAYNYDQPEVSAAIDKLEAIMLKENPKQWAEFFKELKSGQMKQNVIQRLKRDGDPMPEEYVEANQQTSPSIGEQHAPAQTFARNTGGAADGPPPSSSAAGTESHPEQGSGILFVAIGGAALAGIAFVVLRRWR
jgi:hypothetical protein